jgi:iron complex transport system substrate-binding protein
MRYFRYTFLFLLPLLMACRGVNSPVHDDGGETLTLRHADLLSITEHDGYTTVSITNPWDSTRTLHRYVLVPRNAELPEHLPEGDVVRTPLENIAVYTSVHCGLIDELVHIPASAVCVTCSISTCPRCTMMCARGAYAI